MIKRTLMEEILPWLGTDKILLIHGARRVGKTTIVRYLESILTERSEKSLYLAVDHKKHLPMFRDSKLFYRFLREQYDLEGTKKLYLFLDDYQYIREAGTFLKELHEIANNKVQIIATAPSAFKILKVKEALHQQSLIFHLRRLSFQEYLNARSEFSYSQKFLLDDSEGLQAFYNLYQYDLLQYLPDFISWGGYPEIATEADPIRKHEILGEIIHRYVEKDISSFLRIESVDAYMQLMQLLAQDIGNLLNHQSLSTRLGIHKKTLGKYLEIISGTFTFSFIPPYFTDTKRELAKMAKVYAKDMGIISYFLQQTPRENSSFFPDASRVKNFIYTELRKNGHDSGIYFYRTIAKAEIDFIVTTKDGGLVPIKVKFGKKGQKIPVVMKNFMRMYGKKVRKVIVITQDELRFEGQCLFVPLALFPFIELDLI